MTKPTSTILIVDDVEANLQTLESLLDFAQWQLHFASNGVMALAQAAQLQPDLILLDVMMPVMDGFEVCTRLRADPALADVPIIMVTSLDDRASRLRGIEAGADDFVSKPLDGVELRARVRGILRLNRFRRMQEANQRIREQAALIDLAPSAIITCDLGQRITHWNPASERLYGWRAEEVIGQRVNDLLLTDESAEAAGAESISHDAWRREVTHFAKDHRKITVGCHRKLLRDADGRPTALLMINTDLTEQKELEEQCLRAQRLESIGTLASGIAHDLNNVLGPIILSSQILREKVHDDADREVVTIIEECSQRGADLVRQILAFARGTGNQKSELQLRHLLEASVKMLRGVFPPNVVVRTDVPRDLWPVVGNATQLDQILMNLCVNARDAMPGGGDLSVSLENVTLTDSDFGRPPEVQPGTYVCITVSDTGSGMPAEVVARIFDAFFTTKQEGKGTGLGLATVQSLVKGHDGFLTVESEIGCGTRFRVFVPAIPVSAQATLDPANVRGEFPRGNGERVLVVDDEPDILEMMEQTLGSYGYRSLRATDGLEALEVFEKSGGVDLVITDTEMPQIGGSALAQILRGLDSGLPIVLMSGAEVDEKLITTGCVTAFLKKPFTLPDLLHTIDRNLAAPPAVGQVGSLGS